MTEMSLKRCLHRRLLQCAALRGVGVVAAAVILLAAAPAVAADILLNGTITSSASDKLGGVTVSAKELGKTITTTVFTDEAGAYVFPPLPVGHYKVWAQAIGYETSAEPDLALGDVKQQNFTLEPIKDTERQIEDAGRSHSSRAAGCEPRRSADETDRA